MEPHTSEDTAAGRTAGEMYGVSRAGLHPVTRGLGWLYKNPVKWFRPTHVGIGLVEILRARNPHAASLKDLAVDVRANPLRSFAVTTPAFLLNFLTGYTMFWSYGTLRDGMGITPIVAGACAGVCASTITIPMEAVRSATSYVKKQRKLYPEQRFQNYAILDIIKSIHLRRDLRGPIWQILLLREVVAIGTFFSTYEAVRSGFIHRKWEDTLDGVTHMHLLPTVGGAIVASACARATVLPFNIVKDFWIKSHVAADSGTKDGMWRSLALLRTTLARQIRIPDRLVVADAFLKTIPSVLGLVVYEVARTYEANAAAAAIL
eukprot:m.1238512 g.1238512  ORF g.1238512 m.1238512 type:complete len:319 (+) comp24671_c2_seq4:300-1256(+)